MSEQMAIDVNGGESGLVWYPGSGVVLDCIDS